jgi:hypothetical protein
MSVSAVRSARIITFQRRGTCRTAHRPMAMAARAVP